MRTDGDYISREEVLALTDDYELTLQDDEIFFEYIDPKKVAAIPAADVRPVRRGKWTLQWDGDGLWHCSECDSGCIYTSHFCPNCGADMRMEEAKR